MIRMCADSAHFNILAGMKALACHKYHLPWLVVEILKRKLEVAAAALIQTKVDPAMRGRVISFYAMAFFGMQPLGGLFIGFASEHIGVKNTVLAQGIIALLIGPLHVRLLQRRNPKRINAVPTIAKDL